MKIYEQIIQYRRLKKTSTVVKRVLKNENDWSNNVPNFILTIYKLINQGVKIFNNQYYNTPQTSNSKILALEGYIPSKFIQRLFIHKTRYRTFL